MVNKLVQRRILVIAEYEQQGQSLAQEIGAMAWAEISSFSNKEVPTVLYNEYILFLSFR